MKKTIPILLVMLLLVSSVLAFTDYTHEKKVCVKNGGTWISDDYGSIPSPVDYGHCEYPVAQSPSPRSGYKHSCNFDKIESCKLFAYHFKAMPLVIDGKDYTLTYNGQNFLGFPIVTIRNSENRWVYWGPLFEGELKLVRPNFNTGINIFDINFNRVRAIIAFTS